MPRQLAALALLGLAVACAREPEIPAPVADLATERVLPAGRIVGVTSADGAHAWRGVPFAQQPVGELRWRAPRALPPWQDTLEALAPGSECVHFPMSFMSDRDPESVVGSEDCLTLNVFAPPPPPAGVAVGDARLPVMVWIHGGGNMMGESGTYDWSRFAVTHDTLVVALNYRLGLFGWFRHEALWTGDDDAFDRSGNFGTLDLILGLRWVRDNIGAFGGDPDNVTIFGESAGGNDVIALLLSPPAKGLFHRAIAQSGGTWSASVTEAENWSDADEPGRKFSSREVLAQLLVDAEIASDRESARAHAEAMTAEATRTFLRSRSPDQLMAVLNELGDATMDTLPLTIREGTVVREGQMIDRFARGDYTRVPTILGSNRDESKLFMMFDPEHVWKLFGLLPRLRDPVRYERDAEYGSDAWKAAGVDEIAIEMRRVQGPSVFAYRFDWDEQPTRWGTDLTRLVGAAHGLEIPFVMGVASLGPMDALLVSKENTPGREQLSARMGSYWAQFARSGEPGRGSGGDLPHWTAWDDFGEDSPRFIVFDTERDGGLRMSADFVTAQRLAARLVRDDRFSDTERCESLAVLAESFPRYAPVQTTSVCEELGLALRTD
ncbi:MAG: carboxylesterase family protein [Myxococcota bacterium]|nr:carboxylesterase family protein [Myxococcota bacterium]